MFGWREFPPELWDEGPSGEGLDEWREIEPSEFDLGLAEPGRHVLPPGLEEIPVGPFLAAVLSVVDRTKLNGHDAVRLMKAEARLEAHYSASKIATVSEVAHSPAGEIDGPVERDTEVLEFASEEVSAALRLTRRSAGSLLDLAYALAGKLGRVSDQMMSGKLDVPRAQIFEKTIGHLDPEAIDTALDEILEEAQALTTGQLQRRLAKLALRLDPDAEEIGYRKGLEDRKVVAYGNPDHTATIVGSQLPPDRVAAIRQRIERFARHLKTSSEERTMDQLRADVFLDILEGNVDPSGGGVHITVDLATLARLESEPGDLAGYGPVVAEISEKVASSLTKARWDVAIDTDDGNIVTSTLRRRPGADVVGRVRATYATCVFPGCAMPSFHCDLDHRHDYAMGGSTTVDNLEPLCRRHHMAKHHAKWKLKRTDDEDHVWTSPLGHEYVVPRSRAGPSP